jgi:hypothetical protein
MVTLKEKQMAILTERPKESQREIHLLLQQRKGKTMATPKQTETEMVNQRERCSESQTVISREILMRLATGMAIPTEMALLHRFQP